MFIEHMICGTLFLERRNFLWMEREPLYIDVLISGGDKYLFFKINVNINDLKKSEVKDTISLLNALQKDGSNWKLDFTVDRLYAIYTLLVDIEDFREWKYNEPNIRTGKIELDIDTSKINQKLNEG